MASDQPKVSKLFIDSSVLMAASISSTGFARDLIIRAINNKFKIVVSDLVLEETVRNLANKASEALPVLQLFLETLNPEVVSPTKSLVVKVSKVIELKDAPIVAGAIVAKVDYLVSFDRKHLLGHSKEIRTHFKVKVVAPDELLRG